MAIEYSKQKALINIELTQGIDLANQLKIYLDDYNTDKSGEMCELLVEKILTCYEKSLSMLKSSGSAAIKWEEIKETPQCFSSESPGSDISDESQQKVLKKRKALSQWSEVAQVSTGTLADGYSWRKYGQKDILGATFPRAYYRCTHRHTQGCLATKHVQQSDEDQSIFQITCKGRHTCNQTTESNNMLGKGSKKQKTEEYTKEAHVEKETNEMEFNFETSVQTEKLASMLEKIPSFAFHSTRIETPGLENNLFSNALWENDAPTYISHQASVCNYFSVSPCDMKDFGTCQNLQHSELDNTLMLSAPNSVTNSPISDFDISLDQVEFDPDFPFDLVEYFQ